MDQEPTTDFTKFDPHEYLKSYCGKLEVHPVIGSMFVKEMEWLHEAFSTNKIKGTRLLDVGSGPTIRSVISASSHVERIYFSDFTERNREVLKEWLDGTLQFSWDSYFKYVVDAENIGETPADRERSLREKVSGILYIDVQQDNPLAPSFFPQFDVITSALCFIAVAQSDEDYEKMARHVAGLLREGGHLVLFSLYSDKNYTVGDVLFWSFKISDKKVRDIWQSCGFEIVDWKQQADPVPFYNDGDIYYLMVARKVGSN